MAWRRPGDRPLSEPVMVSLLTHICVTQANKCEGLMALGGIFTQMLCYRPRNS